MTINFKQTLLSKRNNFASVEYTSKQTETAFLNTVAEILNNGADIIELAGKNVNTKELIQVAKKLRDLTAVFNALLVIYDRVDVAKVIKADGITLDKNSMRVSDIIPIIDKNWLIGYNINSSEIDQIECENTVDFLISTVHISNFAIKTFIL